MAKGAAGQAVPDVEFDAADDASGVAFEVEGSGMVAETSNPLSDSRQSTSGDWGAEDDWGNTSADEVFEQETEDFSDEEEEPTVRRPSCPSSAPWPAWRYSHARLYA